MRTTHQKTPLFTRGECRIAGLAVLTAVVLTLSAQVVQSMTRPSLGQYDSTSPAAVVLPDVIDAQPVTTGG